MQSDKLIRQITGGILGINNGTKTPKEVGPLLIQLKSIDEAAYDQLFPKYREALNKRGK
jgi:hypothetical protein